MSRKSDDFMEEVKRDIEASRNTPKAVGIVTRDSVAYALWCLANPTHTEEERINLWEFIVKPPSGWWEGVHDYWLNKADEFLLSLSKYPGEKS